ncbi:MAG: DUF2059 domain-containing protein [Planctomycetota bacterium]
MRNIWMGAAAVALAILVVATPNYGMQSDEERGGAPPKAVQDAEKEKKRLEGTARELLKATGAADLAVQMMREMSAQFKMVPNLPEGFTEKFLELAKPEDFVAMVVPIYVEHLREEDMKSAIAYFQSPAGRRWVEAQPAIMRDSSVAGQAWGRKLAEKTMAALEGE